MLAKLNIAKARQVTKKIRRFFQKSPDPMPMRPNKKGHGFHLFKYPDPNTNQKELRKKMVIGTAAVTFTTVCLLVFVGQHSTLDFTVLVVTMIALCGLIAYDIVSRRYWESKVSLKLDELGKKHDRLTREVARNRSDIAILKEGLGELAQNVESEGRGMSPTSSAEAKMIGTIVNKLGALGEQPRAEVGTTFDRDILELEMAPPPNKPPPASELDTELDPDFSKYTDSVLSELVRHAVRNDEIDIFIQPIVALPSRKVRMHEIYARLRAGNGVYIPAERYMDIAGKDDLVPAIDNLILLRSLEMIQDNKGKDGGASYILNISARTLNDSAFMNDLVGFLTKNHKMASQIVFEIPQAEVEQNVNILGPVLEGLAKLGVRFSMDRVRMRRIDISMLKRMHMRYLKMDANWLLTEGQSNTGYARLIRMKKQFDAAGIDIVVEKIESEDMLRELLDFNIDFGQGYLFGKPDHQAAYKEAKAA